MPDLRNSERSFFFVLFRSFYGSYTDIRWTPSTYRHPHFVITTTTTTTLSSSLPRPPPNWRLYIKLYDAYTFFLLLFLFSCLTSFTSTSIYFGRAHFTFRRSFLGLVRLEQRVGRDFFLHGWEQGQGRDLAFEMDLLFLFLFPRFSGLLIAILFLAVHSGAFLFFLFECALAQGDLAFPLYLGSFGDAS